MITRKEAKEIVDWVLQEVYKRRFPYITDGKIDLSKTVVGPIAGTPDYGGAIADGAIYNRQVNANADIAGTKVRIATVLERGTVELASNLETASGVVVQGSDSRLHDTAPSNSTQHDSRYYTEEELGSTASGFGASLIGVNDPNGYFAGDNVQEVLYELSISGGGGMNVDDMIKYALVIGG